jgi:orotate phosphoribosyltransferase
MKKYQEEFVRLALDHEVLRFGRFTLKSGRQSPYFFNLGRISSGAALGRLAAAYAGAIEASGISFDVLFGPAYKGIPLAAAVSIALAERGRDLPFAYNRKEAKDHGEGGDLIGAPVSGQRILIIDDVLTAGTALRESVTRLRAAGAEPVAAIVAMDRQERGNRGASARREIEADLGIRLLALVNVDEVLGYLSHQHADPALIASVRAYQTEYGAAA